jgi:hypothetical protein
MRSRTEIEHICQRYHADQFGQAFADDKAMVQFRIKEWTVRFILPLPNKEEQKIRQRWRALCLSIKSKLECVESGIATFEAEFLPHLVMADGKTFGETVIPQLKDMREHGRIPTIDMLLENKG